MDSKNSELVLEVGTLVAGEYRVERMLAEGPMSLFVVAAHERSEQRVTLGFLRGEVSSRWDAMDRFAHEANAVGELRSEHVAHVLEARVTAEGAPYIVMEYLEGRSLAWELRVHGPFDVASAAEYLIQACDGLAEAHARGIVHRDVNPSNLFLIQRGPGCGAIKIVDFGISNFALSDTADLVTGMFVGSSCYMSPEQLRSTETVDHRGDIWSLGATLFELLTGKSAFNAPKTLPELVNAILEQPAPRLGELRADVPEALAAVVTRCLAKDREARFQSAGELAMALLPFAPSRARVVAERAASRAPAFSTPAGQPDSAGAGDPIAGDRGESGSSLAPTSMTLEAPKHTPSPVVMASAQPDGPLPPATFPRDPDVESELPRVRAPPWVGVATLAVAALLVFLAILVAASDSGVDASGGGDTAVRSVAASAHMRPGAPPEPTAALEPLGPTTPERVELVVRASPESARLTIDGIPVVGNPFRASYPKDDDVHRISASADGYDSKSHDVSLASDVVVDISLDPQDAGP